MVNKKQRIFFFVSIFIFVSSALLSLFVGPYRVGTGEVWKGLVSFLTFTKGETPGVRVVLELRIPRMILAVLAGGSLAVCGSTFQTVLGNPLADPYILGVSGGAAVGAVLSFMVSENLSGGFTLPLFAFLGATLSAFAVYALAGVSGKRSRGRLILTGVIVAAFMNAIILLLISLISPGKIPGALFWLMGDLSYATPGSVRLLFPLVVASTALLLLMARGLDVMLLGDETALQSGLEAEKFKTILFIVVSFLTGAVVCK
jgi:iron complex transport system permease protein